MRLEDIAAQQAITLMFVRARRRYALKSQLLFFDKLSLFRVIAELTFLHGRSRLDKKRDSRLFETNIRGGCLQRQFYSSRQRLA
jgi:hypothetical protein